MATFTGSDDLRGAEFTGADLRGARFVKSDLSGAVFREAQVEGLDLDAPWLAHSSPVLLNGVDVVPLVEAELNRRFPGRELRRADDPDGLRAAWAAVERTWAATLDRAAAMPAGAVDESVAGEWSFAQTLRHLVFATDLWLRRAAQEIDDPFHPVGKMDDGTAGDGVHTPAFVADASYDDVLAARAERVAMMRDFLATATADDLAATRKNPHDPQYPESVLSCVHVVLEEEWEHHRYAVRDLDTIAARTTA